uniref:Uncharacterized protein n=1 Tax=Arion vulgaris TaxID=1028688 RepID=A0A0B7AQW9_9EUPU
MVWYKLTNDELRGKTKQIPVEKGVKEDMLVMDRTHIENPDRKHDKTLFWNLQEKRRWERLRNT